MFVITLTTLAIEPAVENIALKERVQGYSAPLTFTFNLAWRLNRYCRQFFYPQQKFVVWILAYVVFKFNSFNEDKYFS